MLPKPILWTLRVLAVSAFVGVIVWQVAVSRSGEGKPATTSLPAVLEKTVNSEEKTASESTATNDKEFAGSTKYRALRYGSVINPVEASKSTEKPQDEHKSSERNGFLGAAND